MNKNYEDYLLEFEKKYEDFTSEEDVRLETNILLHDLSSVMGFEINKKGHEVTSTYSGRADSIYNNVIFEFKKPNKFNSQKGIDEALYGRDEQDHGLYHYLINFTLEECNIRNDNIFCEMLTRKVGIGFDGKTLIFARFEKSDEEIDLYDENKTTSFPDNINNMQSVKFEYEVVKDLKLGFKRLVLFLRSTTREYLSSECLIERFGPKSDLCRNSINYLYAILNENIDKNPRVATLYYEWNRIFGDIYGEIETDFTKYSKSLCKMYALPHKIELRKILFTLQTYYNIILKLLVSNLMDSLKNPLQKGKYPKDRNELNLLFSGKMQSGKTQIDNFFEIHFFEWFIYAKEFNNDMIQDISLTFDEIETASSIVKPEVVEDVLREMYANLMPKELRHLLGEYYTPTWLVEFALDTAKYYGDISTTLLDPTCGSGSFITHAIKRLKKHNKRLNNKVIIEQATQNIVGYDINPIAVISSKTNYILALGDLSNVEEKINIPIYMCDSVLVPTVHAKQQKENKSIKVKTIVGEFEIPVFNSRKESDLFLKEISKCVESYSFNEFIELMQNEHSMNFDDINIEIAQEFYNKIAELHLSSRDGYWGIILKNAFAPLFAKGGFDVVVGNPPWIAWKAMSDTYRKQTLNIWLSYDIFNKNAYDKITTHDDFAMAVTYVAIDHYCKKNGEVVFILPQTFLKASKGGEGFRKFRITRDRENIPFSVDIVYDMLEVKPFDGFASNKASMIKFIKNKEMKYPMKEYIYCKLKNRCKVNFNDKYNEAISKIQFIKQWAKPINNTDVRSPWLTMDEKKIKQQDKFLGESAYRGRKGIEPCGAKGVYLLDIDYEDGKNVTVHNLVERSRLPAVVEKGTIQMEIEKELVYPMVGGRNISKWGINSYTYMLVPHYSNTDSTYRGIPETEIKVKYRKTYEYLKYFHDILLETRIRNAKFFDKESFPFYRLDNIGDYTWEPYHVVWREQNKKMTACVISSIEDKYLGKKIAVTDSKVLSCSFDNEMEAHYVCSIINSPTITELIDSYTISTNRGVDILKNIAIPRFNLDNKVHKKLAELSISAHEAFKNESDKIEDIENEIDSYIVKIFDN